MPLSADDKIAIQETASRICHVFARGDAEALAELFTEKAVLEAGWANVMTMRIEGRSAIREWGDQVFKLLPGLRYMRIMLSDFTIDGEGDKARMSCFFNELGIDGQTIGTGVYEDVYRRVRGKWLLAHRRTLSDGTREERFAKEALLVARVKATSRT